MLYLETFLNACCVQYNQSKGTKIYLVDDPTYTAQGYEGHVVSILVYRNLNDIQVTIIDNNSVTPPHDMKVLTWFFNYFKDKFTKSLNLNTILKRYNFEFNFQDTTKNYGHGGFCGLISILLNDI